MENTIPFDIKEIEHASFHPIVAAQINDRQFNMIVDTGASRTVLSSELVVSFDKITNDGEEAFAAGINAQRMDVEQVLVPSIWIGGVEFKNMLVFSTDLEAVSSLYEQMAQMRVDGLLGCDFLVDNGGIVDFNKQKIFLNNLKNTHK